MTANNRPEVARTQRVEHARLANSTGGEGPVGAFPPLAELGIAFDTKREHNPDMERDIELEVALAPVYVTAKCYRHQWRAIESNRAPFGPYPDVVGSECRVCGKVRDEAVRRRNRGNKQRGANFERTVAKHLGGRRTGPLGGRDDVVGEMFAAQTKKTINFSLNKARAYLGDLGRIYPTRTPIVVHAKPGRDRDAVVIVRMSDWIALHGPDATSKGAKP